MSRSTRTTRTSLRRCSGVIAVLISALSWAMAAVALAAPSDQAWERGVGLDNHFGTDPVATEPASVAPETTDAAVTDAPVESNANENANANGTDNARGGAATPAAGGASHGEQDECTNEHGPDGVDHPYASTCDGRPSDNGGGGGGGGGRPCQGCVGNADDHNPPGQYRDGRDPNNGYECDGNNGIARGNPAHTGCTTPPPPPPPTCPDGSPMPADGVCGNQELCPDGSPMPADRDCDDDELCPDGSAMPADGDCDDDELCPDGSAMPADGDCDEDELCPDGSPMPADGDCDPDGTPGIDENPPPGGNPPVQVLPRGLTRGPTPVPGAPVASGDLARTGVDSLWFVVAGSFAMAAGSVLLRRKVTAEGEVG